MHRPATISLLCYYPTCASMLLLEFACSYKIEKYTNIYVQKNYAELSVLVGIAIKSTANGMYNIVHSIYLI